LNLLDVSVWHGIQAGIDNFITLAFLFVVWQFLQALLFDNFN